MFNRVQLIIEYKKELNLLILIDIFVHKFKFQMSSHCIQRRTTKMSNSI